MRRLILIIFTLAALMTVGNLAAQLQLDWDLVILSVNGSTIQMRLDVTNNTDQAWNHTFAWANIALYSIDGQFYPEMWLPMITPYTLEPGESDSFEMMHFYFLSSGPHVVQAHLNIPVGDSYLAVGEPETVMIGDTVPLSVGDGSEPARVPIDFYWRTSLYQCIYTAADLGHQPGYVFAISFYNAFGEDVYNNFLNQHIKLYLSVTPLNNLEGGWVNGSNQLLQFDGQINFPSGHNEIRFNLFSPIYLSGSSNLLLTVFRPIHSSYQYTGDPFMADECPNGQALRYFSDAWEQGPNQPPAFSPNHLFNRLPMTVFTIIPTGDPVANSDPLNPAPNLSGSVCPNPFSHGCEIKLQGSGRETGNLKIYDLRGRLIRKLERSAQDSYYWDGKDQDGKACPSGIYIYRAGNGGRSIGGKLIRVNH